MKRGRQNHKKVISACAFLICSMYIVCAQAADEMDTINVSQEARVTGEFIRLGEIATIEGELSSIKNLEDIVVGRTPLAGQDRNLTREQIVARLKQNDVDLNKINFACPHEIKIVSDYEEFSPQDLEALTTDFILSRTPWPKETIKIEDFVCKPVILPKGNVSHGFSVQDNEDYLGKFNADIIFKVKGVETKRVRVSAVIRVMAPVAVCLHGIERHAQVKPSDITMETKDVSALSKNTVLDLQSITGKRARSSIDRGMVLKLDMFETDSAVHKGDIVTIAVNTDLFTITAPGEVLQDGNQGEMVQVSNLTSKNKIYAYVKNNKEVEVRY